MLSGKEEINRCLSLQQLIYNKSPVGYVSKVLSDLRLDLSQQIVSLKAV